MSVVSYSQINNGLIARFKNRLEWLHKALGLRTTIQRMRETLGIFRRSFKCDSWVLYIRCYKPRLWHVTSSRMKSLIRITSPFHSSQIFRDTQTCCYKGSDVSIRITVFNNISFGNLDRFRWNATSSAPVASWNVICYRRHHGTVVWGSRTLVSFPDYVRIWTLIPKT